MLVGSVARLSSPSAQSHFKLFVECPLSCSIFCQNQWELEHREAPLIPVGHIRMRKRLAPNCHSLLDTDISHTEEGRRDRVAADRSR